MKKNTTISALAVAILILAVSAYAAPRLIMEHSTFDFGYAPQNSSISHDFWLKSAGTDTLRILKVVPG